MNHICHTLILFSFLFTFTASAQNTNVEGLVSHSPSCGSHDWMKNLDEKNPGFMGLSNDMLHHLNKIITKERNAKSDEDLYIIPVVFHVVYNNEEENLPDSVIMNQLEILNNCFRRTNEDAIDTRPEFIDLVGDSHIEFTLATEDPEGEATTGITRTSTGIENFGGLLNYGPNQPDEIGQWVTDSLFHNFFRIANSSTGGIDPWDPDKYLNIWIGDLRILEPEFDNLEELVYFALATPPEDHVNWPESLVTWPETYQQGVLIHYVNVGDNNPTSFPIPYNGFNGITNRGKMLVHEVGHYLGLRHIWGDGDCSATDFIDDTPNSPAASNFNCNPFANTCVDDINGEDLPNMVENYMDYSNSNCQNSFTLGQIEIMRNVLTEYRPDLAEVIMSVDENETVDQLILYPNPTNGNLFIDLGKKEPFFTVSVSNYLGQKLLEKDYQNAIRVELLDLQIPRGVYQVKLTFIDGRSATRKFIKQ